MISWTFAKTCFKFLSTLTKVIITPTKQTDCLQLWIIHFFSKLNFLWGFCWRQCVAFSPQRSHIIWLMDFIILSNYKDWVSRKVYMRGVCMMWVALVLPNGLKSQIITIFHAIKLMSVNVLNFRLLVGGENNNIRMLKN